MPLKTLVKVGNITNLSDARYCAGMGVDMLGFSVIEGQPAYVAAKSFQEIRGWVTGPRIVAQLAGLKSASDLKAIIEQYQPDLLELGPAELTLLGAVSLPYLLVIGDEAIPNGIDPAYILTTDASRDHGNVPVLLQISNTAMLEAALSNDKIQGIALEGSSEIRPGLKTYDDLADILEALEEE